MFEQLLCIILVCSYQWIKIMFADTHSVCMTDTDVGAQWPVTDCKPSDQSVKLI